MHASVWLGTNQEDALNHVVFSDLHVSHRTLPHCLEVLRFVHAQAVERDAGIIFLGDFWQERGRVPVEPLNAVIREISNWTQPFIAIPGNHDQVDLGGLKHGLTPIEAASPTMTCLNGPQLLNGALWIPYRRDAEEVTATLEVYKGDFNAVFCHIDVVGAFMNQAIQAGYGILPDELPSDVPIYTGHYHRPHNVEAKPNVCYVGSAYQCSHHEAGDQKRLLVLRESDWTVVEEIPVDIGPRHFTMPVGAVPAQQALGTFRSGDRLIIDSTEPEPRWDANLREAVDAVRSLGTSVDVRVKPKEAEARIADADTMTDEDLWRAYAGTMDMPDDVETEGMSVLHDTDKAETLTVGQQDVRFIAVTLSGYGPFVKEVTYPLSGRGAVLVTGANEDMPGTDSNGSGKTTLVMSPLWALTGRSDPRPDGNTMKGLGKEIINDAAKNATVTLDINVNAKLLRIRRKMTRTSHDLSATYDGVVLTGQDIKLTQAAIDAVVDTTRLARTVFHGQHEVRGWLEATDKAAKDSLGEVIDISIWNNAKDVVDKRLGQRILTLGTLKTQKFSSEERVVEIDEQITEKKGQETTWEVFRLDKLTAAHREVCNADMAADGFDRELAQEKSSLETRAKAEGKSIKEWEAANSVKIANLDKLATEAKKVSTDWQAEHDAKVATARLARDAAATAYDSARQTRTTSVEAEAAGIQNAGANEDEDIRATSKHVELEAVVATLESPAMTADALRATVQERNDALLAATSALSIPAQRGHALKHRREKHEGLTGTCDACEQPIDSGLHASQMAALDAELAIARGEYAAAKKVVTAAQHELDRARGKVTAAVEVDREAGRTYQLNMNAARQAVTDEERRVQRALMDRKTRTSELVSAAQQALYDRLPEGAAAAEASTAVDKLLGLGDNPHASALLTADSNLSSARYDVCPIAATDWTTRRISLEARVNPHTAKKEEAQRAKTRHEEAVNPHTADIKLLAERSADASTKVVRLETEHAELSETVLIDKELSGHFGRNGVQSFILECAIVDLQNRAQRYLDELTDGFMRLELSATTTTGKGKVSEKISRRVMIRRAEGDFVERKLTQLSGGQRRRVLIATSLAFAEFCASRTGMASDFVVFDEVFQHLDAAGRLKIDALVKQMGYGTIIVISHDSDLASAFNRVDRVVMSGDTSTVTIAG